MRRFYPILTATALLALAPAAGAQVPVTMDPLKPCYVSDGEAVNEREAIAVRARGFTPNAALTLRIDNQPLYTGLADALGATQATVPAPFQGFGERAFTLTVQENQIPANFVTATALVTDLTVALRPRTARPSRRIRFSGRGFTQDAPVYGHYLFGGKLRKTVRFAPRATAPCGTFHARRRQIPVRRPAVGDWTLQVDQQRTYSPTPASNAQLVYIRVREVPRP